MTPVDTCACDHERQWHNSCSKCKCPFFLEPDQPPPVVRAWKRGMKDRERREKGRA